MATQEVRPRVIVVADTSPINYLVLMEHIEVLPHFYGTVAIPPSVWEELQDIHTPPVVRIWVANCPPWLEVRSCSALPTLRSISWTKANAKQSH